jgi:hypothetical protein
LEIECIFRKYEQGVEQLDFIHISPSSAGGADGGSNKSDHLSSGG